MITGPRRVLSRWLAPAFRMTWFWRMRSVAHIEPPFLHESSPSPQPALEVKSDLRRQRPRRHIMRPTEGRQKIVERIFIRDVDRGKPQAHFVLVAVEHIVMPKSDIEQTPRRDARRFVSSFSVPGAGIEIRVDPNCEAGHVKGKGTVGVALAPLQVNPAWNS